MLARTRTPLPFLDFAAQVAEVGQAYAAARAAGNDSAVAEALAPLDNTWAEWFVADDKLSRIDFEEVAGAPVTQRTARTASGASRRAGARPAGGACLHCPTARALA